MLLYFSAVHNLEARLSAVVPKLISIFSQARHIKDIVSQVRIEEIRSDESLFKD